MATPLKFAAIGIDHFHIFGMVQNMINAGAHFSGWYTEGEAIALDSFTETFPDVPRATSAETLLNDSDIDLILIASKPCDRADWAIRSMQAGKDVMSDKPGCTTLDQLTKLKACVASTGRIWSVNFSERFEVPAVTKAASLVADGAIGRVVQTIGLGPHRLNRASRPDWFFNLDAYGGIINDIASHQIDQFLFFTGSTQAQVTMASVANYANTSDPGLQDFGQLALISEQGHGYIRVDWYTPDALPTWGDGRLTILGTEGYIELRKYVDVGVSDTTDHLILVNGDKCEKIDASDAGLPYFDSLTHDIRNRTDTAMPQQHTFTVCELALQAQAMANSQFI